MELPGEYAAYQPSTPGFDGLGEFRKLTRADVARGVGLVPIGLTFPFQMPAQIHQREPPLPRRRQFLNAEQSFDLSTYSTFFLSFSQCRRRRRLARFKAAPRNRPLSLQTVPWRLTHQ
jgi:hypothetical protein